MHPNAFLKTYWKGEVNAEIFVAMSFEAAYQARFDEVIKPAIEAITHRGRRLKARRSDLSRSGDSILTDIADGIAHSAMVLADVSTLGRDSRSGLPYRNGNVMYEVGLALACRQPTEVLLIRDDKDKFLFDVSTVPHKHLDFADVPTAKKELADVLVERLREIDFVNDARTVIAAASLTRGEHDTLHAFAQYPMGAEFWLMGENMGTLAAIPRLLDKGLVRTVGVTHDGHAMFAWTQLGRAIASHLRELVPLRDFSRTDSAPTGSDGSQAG